MMETVNLMDIPTRATRRMERYGVLALLFFLTTFGVLYMWDGGGELAPVAHASEAADSPSEAAAVRVTPSSRRRPQRALPSGEAVTRRVPAVSELPLSKVSPAQRDLAQVRRATRDDRDSSMALRAAESAISRNSAARFFEGRMSAPEDLVAAVGSEQLQASMAQSSRGAKEIQPLEYVVKSGDSLSMIAQRELGTVKNLQRLREVNSLKSDFLRTGQILILPHVGDVAPVRGTSIKLANAGSQDAWKTVRVLEGQSLWKIAAKHLGAGSRYTEIMTWNDLSSETVHPGRELRLREEFAMIGGR